MAVDQREEGRHRVIAVAAGLQGACPDDQVDQGLLGEVAALVASGQSNGQIAASLVVSVRTVETHVQHIMNKLGCSTRAQIAAWSAAQPAR